MCFIYVLSVLVPCLIQCSRLMSHNKDLLTYLSKFVMKYKSAAIAGIADRGKSRAENFL